jgi:hypothetical protein
MPYAAYPDSPDAPGRKVVIMTNSERRRAENLPAARPTPPLPSGYLRVNEPDRLPIMTRHDVHIDQRNQSRHILVIRNLQRQAIEGAAVEARNGYVDAAAIEARRRVLTEAKFQLQRARQESQILAGDDLELAAKFAQLDDDYFHFVRLVGME